MVQNWVQRRGTERDVERRTQQIKEICRLGTALRAEIGLEHLLGQIVEAITSTLGFGAAVLNLTADGADTADVVATAGLSEPERQRLVTSPPSLARLHAVMRPEFCVSRSYFISHNYKHLLDGIEGVTLFSPAPPSAQRAPDAWHPEDVLLVPLLSPRDDRLIGLFSLDQPEDGKIPTLETIEMLELFASQAAIAIETSRVFQEREHERQVLEAGLFELLYHLEQVRQGNMDVRVQLAGSTLAPMAESLNAVAQTLGTLLANVRSAGTVVSRKAAETRDRAASLADRAQQQSRQILDIAIAVESMAGSIGSIAGTAHEASAVAREAIEISNVGREAAERAAGGMIAVREMALQSIKKMKRLSESAQDIGEIVQMVADFASQTNLLALNAAIEAARAGENGHGFAIVAQEIRKLASSSAEATKQIHARIKGIQTETNAVVVTIEHSTQQVVLQSELAAQAGSALEAVDTVTQRIAQAIGDMNATATQQAEAATVVSGAIGEIAHITTQTRDGMEQMRAAMDHLVELAHSLQDSMSVFRLAGVAASPPLLSAAPPHVMAEQATQPMLVLPSFASGPGQQRVPLAAPGAMPGVRQGAVTTALPPVEPAYPAAPPPPDSAPRTTRIVSPITSESPPSPVAQPARVTQALPPVSAMPPQASGAALPKPPALYPDAFGGLPVLSAEELDAQGIFGAAGGPVRVPPALERDRVPSNPVTPEPLEAARPRTPEERPDGE